jgi:hypothetical protein
MNEVCKSTENMMMMMMLYFIAYRHHLYPLIYQTNVTYELIITATSSNATTFTMIAKPLQIIVVDQNF